MNKLLSLLFSLATLPLILGACSTVPEYSPTPTKTPLAVYSGLETATASPTPLIQPTATDRPTASPAPATRQPVNEGDITPTSLPYSGTASGSLPTPPPQPGNLPADHYLLARPIPEGFTDYLDRTYPYGGTAGGRLRPHTGVEFFNPEGTPVVAAANAVVEFAGTDAVTIFGPSANFYGNLIILRLTAASYSGRPVYLFYGHLSQIGVAQGDAVTSGQEIGKVGGTGAANGGAHLHFEVRLDDPTSYITSTRNPDLWIKPYGGYGTLAGRVVGESGQYLPGVSLTIRTEGWVRYTWTYSGAENIPDEGWGENFTYGDLPAGIYSVTFSANGKSYREQVEIRKGATSWLEFVVTGS